MSEERVGAEEAREVEATAAEATSAPAWYLERSPEEGEAPSPVLEVYGHAAERGLRVRAKLIWAIIIIVFLALLGFIFASRAGAEVAGPPAASGAGVERLAARESGASETSEPRVVAGPPRRDGQACRS